MSSGQLILTLEIKRGCRGRSLKRHGKRHRNVIVTFLRCDIP